MASTKTATQPNLSGLTSSAGISSINSSSSSRFAKSRKSIVVKPILKKLHVHSHSERNSLDLDRGWDEQPAATSPELEYGSFDYGARDMDDLHLGGGGDRRHLFGASFAAAPAGGGGAAAKAKGTSRSKSKAKAAKAARDVSFTLSASDLLGGTSAAAGGASANAAAAYSASSSHARSTSGASIATTTSGRNGSFVHPFQQTPRTSTPPLLSYANSVASLQQQQQQQQQQQHHHHHHQREYSSTIAEDDGDEDEIDQGDRLDDSLSHPTTHNSSSSSSSSATATTKLYTTTTAATTATNTTSTTSATTTSSFRSRRPSLTSSQRTISDGTHSLRVTTTTHSNSAAPVPRLTQGAVNHSRSDLQSSSVSSAADSALAGAAAPLTVTSQKTSPSLPTASPISPFRTSLDMNGFRLRSRSEIDTATRQEQVREARRKFEAKEREKEEKYAREQIRKRERADAREAQKYERAQAQLRKTSWGNTSSLSSPRNSSSSPEKGGYSGYQPSDARPDEVQFQMPSRSRTAKQRTNGVWTAFMLWLRTRLIKLGRR